MLRISVFNEPFSTTLRVEGKLAHEWVQELRGAWAAISFSAAERKRIIDLFGVSFVDDAGRELLEEMYAGGAKLVGSGPMITALIEEIQQDEKPRMASKMKNILFSLLAIGAVVLFLAQESFGQAAETLTLEQAIALSKAQNRQLKIQKAETENAKDDVAIFKTKRLPSLSTDIYGSGLLAPISWEYKQGAFGTYPGIGPVPNVDTKVTAEPTFNVAAVAELKQPLTQLYRINLGVKAKELSHQIAQEATRRTEQQVVHDVRQLYYGILQSGAAVKSQETSIASLIELERVLADRVREQSALPMDLLDVKARLAQAQQDKVTTENNLETQKEQLNLLLGRDPSTPFGVEAAPQLEGQEEDLPAARARAMERHPELRESELKVKVADYDRRIKKAERLPDVGGFANYFSPFNVDVVPKNIAAAGIQVTWEPFDWGRKKKELSQKERAVEQAQWNSQQTRDAIQIELSRAHRRLKETKEQANVSRLQAEATQERLRVVTNQFEQKAALLKDVLDVQTKLAEAQYRQHEALLAFWNAKADFAKAIGDE